MSILSNHINKLSEFTDVSIIKTPDKLSPTEIVRGLRLALAAEEDAINTYTSLADSIDNELVKKSLLEIADEERVHVGELQELINTLEKDEEALLHKGSDEVIEKMDQPEDTEEVKESFVSTVRAERNVDAYKKRLRDIQKKREQQDKSKSVLKSKLGK
jgi:rubrerythrin